MAWWNPGEWNWDALSGPLALFGTGAGLYSNWQNAKAQEAAYKFAQDQARDYQNSIKGYYDLYGKYQAQQANAIGEGLGQMFSLMSAPLDWESFYKPFTDAEVSARRRGATAQASLRTGGNEGAYIDNLVSTAIAEGESPRVDRAIDAATRMRATQMQALGPMAQLMLGRYGAPPLPIPPSYPGYPNYSNMMGSTDPLGQFLAWQRGRKAAEEQQRSSSRLEQILQEMSGAVSPYGTVRTWQNPGVGYSLYGNDNIPWWQ